jgi:hypothetical protein
MSAWGALCRPGVRNSSNAAMHASLDDLFESGRLEPDLADQPVEDVTDTDRDVMQFRADDERADDVAPDAGDAATSFAVPFARFSPTFGMDASSKAAYEAARRKAKNTASYICRQVFRPPSTPRVLGVWLAKSATLLEVEVTQLRTPPLTFEAKCFVRLTRGIRIEVARAVGRDAVIVEADARLMAVHVLASPRIRASRAASWAAQARYLALTSRADFAAAATTQVDDHATTHGADMVLPEMLPVTAPESFGTDRVKDAASAVEAAREAIDSRILKLVDSRLGVTWLDLEVALGELHLHGSIDLVVDPIEAAGSRGSNSAAPLDRREFLVTADVRSSGECLPFPPTSHSRGDVIAAISRVADDIAAELQRRMAKHLESVLRDSTACAIVDDSTDVADATVHVKTVGLFNKGTVTIRYRRGAQDADLFPVPSSETETDTPVVVSAPCGRQPVPVLRRTRALSAARRARFPDQAVFEHDDVCVALKRAIDWTAKELRSPVTKHGRDGPLAVLWNADRTMCGSGDPGWDVKVEFRKASPAPAVEPTTYAGLLHPVTCILSRSDSGQLLGVASNRPSMAVALQDAAASATAAYDGSRNDAPAWPRLSSAANHELCALVPADVCRAPVTRAVLDDVSQQQKTELREAAEVVSHLAQLPADQSWLADTDDAGFDDAATSPSLASPTVASMRRKSVRVVRSPATTAVIGSQAILVPPPPVPTASLTLAASTSVASTRGWSPNGTSASRRAPDLAAVLAALRRVTRFAAHMGLAATPYNSDCGATRDAFSVVNACEALTAAFEPLWGTIRVDAGPTIITVAHDPSRFADIHHKHTLDPELLRSRPVLRETVERNVQDLAGSSNGSTRDSNAPDAKKNTDDAKLVALVRLSAWCQFEPDVTGAWLASHCRAASAVAASLAMAPASAVARSRPRAKYAVVLPVWTGVSVVSHPCLHRALLRSHGIDAADAEAFTLRSTVSGSSRFPATATAVRQSLAGRGTRVVGLAHHRSAERFVVSLASVGSDCSSASSSAAVTTVRGDGATALTLADLLRQWAKLHMPEATSVSSAACSEAARRIKDVAVHVAVSTQTDEDRARVFEVAVLALLSDQLNPAHDGLNEPGFSDIESGARATVSSVGFTLETETSAALLNEAGEAAVRKYSLWLQPVTNGTSGRESANASDRILLGTSAASTRECWKDALFRNWGVHLVLPSMQAVGNRPAVVQSDEHAGAAPHQQHGSALAASIGSSAVTPPAVLTQRLRAALAGFSSKRLTEKLQDCSGAAPRVDETASGDSEGAAVMQVRWRVQVVFRPKFDDRQGAAGDVFAVGTSDVSPLAAFEAAYLQGLRKVLPQTDVDRIVFAAREDSRCLATDSTLPAYSAAAFTPGRLIRWLCTDRLSVEYSKPSPDDDATAACELSLVWPTSQFADKSTVVTSVPLSSATSLDGKRQAFHDAALDALNTHFPDEAAALRAVRYFHTTLSHAETLRSMRWAARPTIALTSDASRGLFVATTMLHGVGSGAPVVKAEHTSQSSLNRAYALAVDELVEMVTNEHPELEALLDEAASAATNAGIIANLVDEAVTNASTQSLAAVPNGGVRVRLNDLRMSLPQLFRVAHGVATGLEPRALSHRIVIEMPKPVVASDPSKVVMTLGTVELTLQSPGATRDVVHRVRFRGDAITAIVTAYVEYVVPRLPDDVLTELNSALGLLSATVAKRSASSTLSARAACVASWLAEVKQSTVTATLVSDAVSSSGSWVATWNFTSDTVDEDGRQPDARNTATITFPAGKHRAKRDAVGEALLAVLRASSAITGFSPSDLSHATQQLTYDAAARKSLMGHRRLLAARRDVDHVISGATLNEALVGLEAEARGQSTIESADRGRTATSSVPFASAGTLSVTSEQRRLVETVADQRPGSLVDAMLRGICTLANVTGAKVRVKSHEPGRAGDVAFRKRGMVTTTVSAELVARNASGEVFPMLVTPTRALPTLPVTDLLWKSLKTTHAAEGNAQAARAHDDSVLHRVPTNVLPLVDETVGGALGRLLLTATVDEDLCNEGNATATTAAPEIRDLRGESAQVRAFVSEITRCMGWPTHAWYRPQHPPINSCRHTMTTLLSAVYGGVPVTGCVQLSARDFNSSLALLLATSSSPTQKTNTPWLGTSEVDLPPSIAVYGSGALLRTVIATALDDKKAIVSQAAEMAAIHAIFPVAAMELKIPQPKSLSGPSSIKPTEAAPSVTSSFLDFWPLPVAADPESETRQEYVPAADPVEARPQPTPSPGPSLSAPPASTPSPPRLLDIDRPSVEFHRSQQKISLDPLLVSNGASPRVIRRPNSNTNVGPSPPTSEELTKSRTTDDVW